MGRRRRYHCEHDYAGGYARYLGGGRFRDRCRAAESVHGETLEESLLPLIPGHDMGEQRLRFSTCIGLRLRQRVGLFQPD